MNALEEQGYLVIPGFKSSKEVHNLRTHAEAIVDAFDEAGRLRQPKALSINKIGHAMHDLDPVFEDFSHGSALAGVARSAGGGEVRWHQDATYFWTDPISVTTFWFALESADRQNGCLWARFVVENGNTRVPKLDQTPWPTEESAVPLETVPHRRGTPTRCTPSRPMLNTPR
ncbi:MAG TPA: phytanoyl-CoA dioxygenase family protein [Candidatus Baltobacteraceae bacterium]|jgi:phytanoyl-CoA hydroxylase